MKPWPLAVLLVACAPVRGDLPELYPAEVEAISRELGLTCAVWPDVIHGDAPSLCGESGVRGCTMGYTVVIDDSAPTLTVVHEAAHWILRCNGQGDTDHTRAEVWDPDTGAVAKATRKCRT